jgi:hypothetical protein
MDFAGDADLQRVRAAYSKVRGLLDEVSAGCVRWEAQLERERAEARQREAEAAAEEARRRVRDVEAAAALEALRVQAAADEARERETRRSQAPVLEEDEEMARGPPIATLENSGAEMMVDEYEGDEVVVVGVKRTKRAAGKPRAQYFYSESRFLSLHTRAEFFISRARRR